MEIPLLNSSASSLSPKELHSLTKREASSQSNSSTGFTQKSTDLSSSSCSHLEIEEIKESANLIKKSAETSNIELMDIKPKSPLSSTEQAQRASEQEKKQYSPAQSIHLLELAQRHLKTCVLIFQTSFVIVILGMFLVIFSSIMTAEISFDICLTLVLSLTAVILLRCTYTHINSTFPQESSDESSRIIVVLIIKVITMVYMIGGVGAAKIQIDLIAIINSFQENDEMSQAARINMTDLMITLLGFIVLLGLFILFSFLLVILFAFVILHLVLALLTCSHYYLLSSCAKSFQRFLRRILNQRIAALQKYKVLFKKQNNLEEEPPCQICLEIFEEGERIYRLQCGTVHSFHVDCLEKWAARSAICPSCRKPFSEL